MLKLVLVVACAIAHLQLVSAHSVLNGIKVAGSADAMVKGWAAADGTGNPCGKGSPTGNVQLVANEGDKIEAEWQLNAGDGNGYLSAKYDGGAGVDFNSNVAGMEVPMYTDDDGVEKELKLTKVKQPYAFSFTAPAASECTGVLGGGDEVGVCNFQIRVGGWKSCVSILVKNIRVTPPPPPPGPKCEKLTAASLNYCSHLVGKLAIIKPNTTPAMLLEADATVAADVAMNLNNAAIIRGGKDAVCIQAAKDYMCAREFTGCVTEGEENPAARAHQVCRNTCTAFRNLCTIDATHLDLWPCSDVVGSDVDGDCLADNLVPQYVSRPSDDKVRSEGDMGFQIGWKIPSAAGQQYAVEEKFVGDAVTFDFSANPTESVFQFADKEDFDKCNMDTTKGELLTSPKSKGKYKFLVTQAPNSKVYFASALPGSCAAGLKIEIKVIGGGLCTDAVKTACAGLGRTACTANNAACGGCLDGKAEPLQSCTGVAYDYGSADDTSPGGPGGDAAAALAPMLAALLAPLLALLRQW